MKGIVVELEDHTNSDASNAGGGSGTVFSGSQLTNELNWYTFGRRRLCQQPLCLVWHQQRAAEQYFTPAALSTWQLQTYNAIRNAGNNSPILMELVGGGNPRHRRRRSGHDAVGIRGHDQHHLGPALLRLGFGLLQASRR